MKFFENTQRFDLAGRFSVEQRRFGWMLRKHPKAKGICSKRGAHWQLIVHHDGLSDLSDADLDAVHDDALARVWSVMRAIGEEKKRRAEPVQDATLTEAETK